MKQKLTANDKVTLPLKITGKRVQNIIYKYLTITKDNSCSLTIPK